MSPLRPGWHLHPPGTSLSGAGREAARPEPPGAGAGITVAFGSRRLEAIPAMVARMRTYHTILLEEPTCPGFSDLLAGPPGQLPHPARGGRPLFLKRVIHALTSPDAAGMVAPTLRSGVRING